MGLLKRVYPSEMERVTERKYRCFTAEEEKLGINIETTGRINTLWERITTKDHKLVDPYTKESLWNKSLEHVAWCAHDANDAEMKLACAFWALNDRIEHAQDPLSQQNPKLVEERDLPTLCRHSAEVHQNWRLARERVEQCETVWKLCREDRVQRLQETERLASELMLEGSSQDGAWRPSVAFLEELRKEIKDLQKASATRSLWYELQQFGADRTRRPLTSVVELDPETGVINDNHDPFHRVSELLPLPKRTKNRVELAARVPA